MDCQVLLKMLALNVVQKTQILFSLIDLAWVELKLVPVYQNSLANVDSPFKQIPLKDSYYTYSLIKNCFIIQKLKYMSTFQ